MSETEVFSKQHRFCPGCGTEAVTGGSFCSECGRSLLQAGSAAETSNSLQEEPSISSVPPSHSSDALPTSKPVKQSNDLTAPFRRTPQVERPSTVPPPLQTPLIPPSGKKPLRRQPVFWIALGVVVLAIIAGISAAFLGSHSQSYENGYYYGTLSTTNTSFDGYNETPYNFCLLDAAPAHDTGSPQDNDWLRGCAAGITAVQSGKVQVVYGNTGSTGNSGS